MNRYERQAIRSATRVALLTALTCGAMLTGCAAEQRPSSLPRLVALVPANFDTGTHEELKPGLEPTMRLLRMFLKHNHAEVIDIPMVEFQEAYLAALGGEKPPAPDSPEYAAVMGSLLEAFSPRPGDSVLLVPHVMSRHAELVGSRGKWDGVIQPVQVDHRFSKDTYQVRGVFSNKNSTGISVRIRIFGPAPALVHEGYGGIALPFKFVVGSGITALEGREIFNDPKRIARGIAIAFDPYVPRQLH